MKKSELRQIIKEEIRKLQEKKQLSRKEVIQRWKEDVLPVVIQKYGKNDIPARRESFNNFVDMLHKDGEISDELVQNITLPDKYEK